MADYTKCLPWRLNFHEFHAVISGPSFSGTRLDVIQAGISQKVLQQSLHRLDEGKTQSYRGTTPFLLRFNRQTNYCNLQSRVENNNANRRSLRDTRSSMYDSLNYMHSWPYYIKSTSISSLYSGMRTFRIFQKFWQICCQNYYNFIIFSYFHPALEHFSQVSHSFSTISREFGSTYACLVY